MREEPPLFSTFRVGDTVKNRSDKHARDELVIGHEGPNHIRILVGGCVDTVSTISRVLVRPASLASMKEALEADEAL